MSKKSSTFDKIKKHHIKDVGQLVIDGFNIVKLVDIIDGKDDYYFQYKRFSTGVYYYSSICIGYIKLKGQLSAKDYKELERVWELNSK